MEEKYEVVIGLEIHIQLNTKSKAFCSDVNLFGGAPNEHTSAISLAYPGTLPMFNEKLLEKAVILGLALNAEINQNSYFDRKNYFYADSPKGYQITQDASPICKGGHFQFYTNNEKKVIRLHHIHIEEDAGKLIHDLNEKNSFIDLNRAGTPLLEVVTEPDFRSADEVEAFMYAMQHLVRWLGISDGNMEEGSMRCDVNVSLKPVDYNIFGERCEIKNVNSIKFAKKAIKYEQERQLQLLENGQKIQRQTLKFDANNGTTAPIRDKESANDYRYFPEPDLTPIRLSNEKLSNIRQQLTTLPYQYLEDWKELYPALTIEDALVLLDERDTASFFDRLLKQTDAKKILVNILIQKLIPLKKEIHFDFETIQTPDDIWIMLIELIASQKIPTNIALNKVIPLLFEEQITDYQQFFTSFMAADDSIDVESITKEVMAQFPDKVIEYKKGKKGLIGFFMGQIMKKIENSNQDPKKINQIVMALLNSE